MSATKQTKQSPRRMLIIIVAIIVVLLMAAWKQVSYEFSYLMPIENVKIEGTFSKLSLSELKQKITGDLNGGYFTADITKIRQTLLGIPWVEDAMIRRQWPSGLYIKVVEKNAVAYWGDNSLISSRGEMFTPAVVDHDKPMPHLLGPEGLHTKVWNYLHDINKQLETVGLVISRLELDERRAWALNISDGKKIKDIEVKLGRADVDYRLDKFVRVFPEISSLNLSDVQVIDLRYPNGFAMKKNKTEIGITTRTRNESAAEA